MTRTRLFDHLGGYEVWGSLMAPPPLRPRKRPEGRPTMELNELHRRCLLHLDDWGKRTSGEVREDIKVTADHLWHAMDRLRAFGLVVSEKPVPPEQADYWSLTEDGHAVADELSAQKALLPPPVVKRRINPDEIPEDHVESAIRMYAAEGMSVEAVASRLHVSKSRMSGFLCKAGVLRKPGRRPRPAFQTEEGHHAPTET